MILFKCWPLTIARNGHNELDIVLEPFGQITLGHINLILGGWSDSAPMFSIELCEPDRCLLRVTGTIG